MKTIFTNIIKTYVDTSKTEFAERSTLPISASITLLILIGISTTSLAEPQLSAKVSPVAGYETLHGRFHRLRELDMTWTTKEPKGYAFIMQILERSEPFYTPEPPRVVVHLRHEPSWGPPEEWSWYVSDPNDTVLAHELTVKWYGQASCPDELTSLQINGPGGLATQNPLNNPVAGYFEYQSASVDRVKDICVQWAEKNKCGDDCQLEETFNLFDDVSPEPNDYIELSGSCASGPLPASLYLPKIEVMCTRANY